MTEWKEYNELTEKQQAEVRECIRRTWLEDAKEEAKACPNDDILPEIIEHLQNNDETCAAMIEDQLEPDNEMFRKAMRWICSR